MKLGLDLRELKHSFTGEIKETHNSLIQHEEQSKIDLAATSVLITRLSNLKNKRLLKLNDLKNNIEKDLKNSELQYKKLCEEEIIEKKLDKEITRRIGLCANHTIELAKKNSFLYDTQLKSKHGDFILKYHDFLYNSNLEYKKLNQLDVSMREESKICHVKLKHINKFLKMVV